MFTNLVLNFSVRSCGQNFEHEIALNILFYDPHLENYHTKYLIVVLEMPLDTIQRHAKFKRSWSNRNWHKTIVKHNKMRKPRLGGNPSISKHFMSMSIFILLLFWCAESYKTASHYGAPSLSLIVCMKEPSLSTRHIKEPVCMRASHSRSHNLWAKAGSYLWHCLDIAASIFRIHQHMRSTVHGRGTFRLPVMATA